ncbi:unnamed protein product [Sphacelaria rigidula]
MLSPGKTPRTGRSPRRGTQSERRHVPPRMGKHDVAAGETTAPVGSGGSGGVGGAKYRNSRAASASYMNTARTTVGSPRAVAAGASLRTANDVFEVVADGNAEVLVEMIKFPGAMHLCELRSKRQEDYGRNLLHCAVANGQLKTLQVLLKHKVFDPNQVTTVTL